MSSEAPAPLLELTPPTKSTAAAGGEGGGVSARPLEGKLAIITGASRGIGAAIARNLASKGANLVLSYTSDTSTAPTEALAASLRAAHSTRCLLVQADLSSPPTACARIISAAASHFAHPETGAFQIDILINNAGVAKNQRVGLVDPETFHALYTVNVLAPLLLLQHALPFLPHDRSGRVVNLSSVSSSCGFRGQSVYGGTKAALEAMTRTWARELAERCTVNAVNPGPVDTDMFRGTSEWFRGEVRPFVEAAPLMRGGAREEVGGGADDVAGVVGMLCSAEAGWCTGSVVCANGGMRFSF